MKRLLALFLVLTVSLLADEQKNFIEDFGKFLSENERNSYLAIVEELHAKTGFSLYLYTASGEVRDAAAFADSLCREKTKENSLLAVIFFDGSAHHRAFKMSPEAVKWISPDAAERLAQKYLLPEFRKENYGHGILVFGAELSKNVARLNDVRLLSPMPRPTEDGIPTMAWILIFIVLAAVVIAYAYFVRQSSQAERRGKIRDFGGFPHQKFNSGFGD